MPIQKFPRGKECCTLLVSAARRLAPGNCSAGARVWEPALPPPAGAPAGGRHTHTRDRGVTGRRETPDTEGEEVSSSSSRTRSPQRAGQEQYL